jgi:hypothetical protein
MRRALAGIVPGELLNRRRKAFVNRAPIAAISIEWLGLSELTSDMASSLLKIVDQESFRESLEAARQGAAVPIVPLMRGLSVEAWLRSLARSGFEFHRKSASQARRTAEPPGNSVRAETWAKRDSIQLDWMQENEKEDQTMKYEKPEVRELDDAVRAIQGHGKTSDVAFDIPLQMNDAATSGAYEADE